MKAKPGRHAKNLNTSDRLRLVPISPGADRRKLSSIDLFSGAGGITEGFREEGYKCLYANDLMPEAMETFNLNHPEAITDCRKIELIDPAQIRRKLQLSKGQLDVLVGGPPCQGFSI